MGDKDGVALTLADLAKIARLRGDLRAALVGYKQARAIAQEIADNRAVAYAAGGPHLPMTVKRPGVPISRVLCEKWARRRGMQRWLAGTRFRGIEPMHPTAYQSLRERYGYSKTPMRLICIRALTGPTGNARTTVLARSDSSP